MAKIIASVCLVLGAFILIFGLKLTSRPVFKSPQGSASITPVSPTKSHLIYAFLPYWNVKLDPPLHPHLTHLAYFALEPESDGNIKTHANPRESHLGWRWLHQDVTQIKLKEAQSLGIKTDLVLTLFDDQIITSLATDSAAQTRLVDHLIDLTREFHFTGINLDYEPSSDLPATTSKQFTSFISQLHQAARDNTPPLTLSLDTYARSAKDPADSPLADWHPFLDYLIIMAYDYHQPSSSTAGPVAPLYPSNLSSHAILKNLAQFQQLVPLNKVLLGLPLYGYQWQTTNSDFQSHTFPNTGKTIYYKDLSRLLSSPQTMQHWDDLSQTPWAVIPSDNKIFQLYYDNLRSYQHKLSLVSNSPLAGISLWAIGYDANAPEIWQLLEQL